MAPFNTHFLIAEKLWPHLDDPWREHYGMFCFGCIAPDVDKISPALTQKDTHFFDRSGEYDLMATHRSAEFIRQQADFFCRPFAGLCPWEQAFALGYLCHLCVDEVSKHMWRRDTWLKFKDIGPGLAFAALDEAARQQTQNYPAIVRSLDSITAPDIIPRIPPTDLEVMLRGTRNFAHTADTENEFLALVDLFDNPTPEERRKKQKYFKSAIHPARQQAHIFKLDLLVEASLARSRLRLTELIEGRAPEPGYPLLEI